MPRVLMVIAPEMFRDEEYAHPKAVLEGLGATVVTASTRPGECHGKLGMIAEATSAVADAEAGDYAAVVFVGGGGAEVFFDDPASHALARTAHDLGRVVAAICIAPSILARAGLLEEIRVTAFPSQHDDLVAHGALWTGAPVEVSGPFITANGPDAARDFGLAIADALGLP
ncbi:MAG: DJ-1/PfpI family protein [Coriobacteriia bacterium]|nr:DJ-1/PfpI family protein [Coriobacteriia bacterium]